MIGIIDTGGNYGSLLSAFEKLSLSAEVTDKVKASHRRLVLPGVGRADVAMGRLRVMGLASLIPSLSVPILGICVGFHVLCKSSEEGPTECMGVFRDEVRRLSQPRFGWQPDVWGWVYMCHGYASFNDRGGEIIEARQNNFTGVQFHPEKSGKAGLEFLKNWANESQA